MPHRPVRRPHRTVPLLVAAVAAVVATVVPALTTGAAAAATAAHVGATNAAVVARWEAAGATLSADGRWMELAGARVSLFPASYADCVAGYVCLWEDTNYVGRSYQRTGAGTTVNSLGTASFDNVMSSWANRTTSLDARWFYNTNLGGTTRCMNPGASSNNVGTADNDQASSFKIYTDGAACS